MKTLIAVSAIAAGAISDMSAAVEIGQTFDADDAIADTLIENGSAKVYVPVPTGKKVKGRVLMGCDLGLTDDVVTLSSDDAQSYQNAGLIDTNPDAVAYATGLDQVGKRQRAAQEQQQ